MKNKKMKPLVIITIIVLVLASISLFFYARESSKGKLESESSNVSENIEDNSNDIGEEDSIEESMEEQIIDQEEQKEEIKQENASNSSSSSKTTSSSSNSKNTSSNSSSKSSTNASSTGNSSNNTNQSTSKTWTDAEIEAFVKQTITNFRLDFKTLEACNKEGEYWMNNYGFMYSCAYLPIPNTSIVASMLTLETGDIYCDGDWTGSHKYSHKNAKIGNVAYLRQLGYACENIHGDIY